MPPTCYSIIMAGGQGTRFWPLSRAQRPKQLLSIVSPKTLIRETAERILPFTDAKRTIIVTVAAQLQEVKKNLPMLPRGNFLAEPEGRNTAPCVGLAALEVTRRNSDAIMILLPADHWIGRPAAFRRTLRTAVKLAAQSGKLVTIGIRPSYPETGYGYIVKGKLLAKVPGGGAFQVSRFTEKPDLPTARRLIRRGCLWNGGVFVWKASVLLELMQRYEPKIARPLENIRLKSLGEPLGAPKPKIRDLIALEYKKMPNISIDYAVVEKASAEGNVLTLEADFAWSDVGSWAAVHQLLPHDSNGNAGRGSWLAFGAKNCLVHATDRLVVLLGAEDVFVVDAPDALLVGRLTRSQEVRGVVEGLKKKGYGSYTVE